MRALGTGTFMVWDLGGRAAECCEVSFVLTWVGADREEDVGEATGTEKLEGTFTLCSFIIFITTMDRCF